MAHADGLSAHASDVRIGGIKVGGVSGLSLDPKTYKAIVRLRIRSDVQIPGELDHQRGQRRFQPGRLSRHYAGLSSRTLPPGSTIAAR